MLDGKYMAVEKLVVEKLVVEKLTVTRNQTRGSWFEFPIVYYDNNNQPVVYYDYQATTSPHNMQVLNASVTHLAATQYVWSA